jgi:WD40 repeat protein
VKHRDNSSITLGASEAVTAIAHFIENRRTNPGLRFLYTTNASVGREQKSPMSKEIKAIDTWEQIRQGSLHGTEQNEAVQGIRTILVEKIEKPSKLNKGTWKIFRNFITNPNNDDELLDLIRRFEWNTKAPEAQSLGTILERLLIERQHATDNIQAQEQYQKLFVYVFKRLCKREIKRLTVEERERLLSQPTLSQTDHQLLNKVVVWVQALEVRVQKNEERLGTIEQRLDQEFSKPYAGQDVASRVQELIRDYTTKLFVGREDALSELDKFLTQTDKKYLTITAPAGFGKTVLLANWIAMRQDKGYFIAYHFFQRDDITRSVSNAYRNLLRQLHDYYESSDKSLPTNEDELRDKLCYLLENYEVREDKPLVMVVDGLDEASPERSLSLFLPQPLPKGLYVIVSVRLNEVEKLDNLNLPTQVTQKLHLNPLLSPTIADWLRRTGNEKLVSLAQDETFVAQVCDRTEGIPLFLKYLIDELVEVAQQGEESAIRKTLAATPKGFANYIREQYQALDRLEAWRSRRELRKIFYFLTIAKGELSSYDFVKLTGESPVGLPWQVSRWFKIREIGNLRLFSFAHSTLAEQFAALPEINENTEECQEKLIEYCAKWKKHQKSRYALRHYAEHLSEAKQWDELYNLLTEFEYIDTKICTLGSQPLIEDYDLTFNPDLITFEQGLQRKADCLKLIQGAFRLSAHILEQDKTQLAGRLLGHLMRFDAPEIQGLLSQAKQWKAKPWLRPLTPSLTSPDEPLIRTLTGHSGSIWSVAVTPDGEQVISGSQDGTLKIWNLNTGILEHTIPAHNDSVNAVCTDGLHIISGSRDKTIKVWNLKTRKLVHTLTEHSKLVNATVLTPDGSKIISGSSDCSLKVWDLKTRQELDKLVGHRASITSVTTVFTKNKQWVVSGSDNDTLRVWNLETGKEEFPLGECDWIWSLAATLDGERVISGSQDGTLTIWKVETWEKECTFKGHSKPIRTVAVTPDGKHMISGSSDGIIKIWKVGTWENEATFTAHTAWVLAVAVTPDGNQIISASGNNLSSNEYLLKVWNLEKCIKQFSCNNECDPKKGHSSSVEVIAFTPDGKEVISASKDGILKTWEVGTWENKAIFKGQSKSADLIGDDDRQKHFILEADEVNCFLHSTRNTKDLLMATTADGNLQVWASGDETLKVWNVSARQFIANFTGESEIKCCAIASDELTIVAGEASGRLHFLRLEGTASS